MNEFDALVISCEPEKGKFKVVLDRTAFFPEEGGQSCDKGTLGGFEVISVHEKDLVIAHFLSEPLNVGGTVHGVIDREKRFSDMQQHTGEHIVSGIVHSMFGYDNVGFHLGSAVTTMDYSGELHAEDIRKVELAANRAVYENIPVNVLYPDPDELERMDYRSKKELTGKIRIVEIPGYDLCACCAPHVSRTGEIGIIKIVDFEKYKGGTRVYLLCGYRALSDYNAKESSVMSLSALLSAKPEEVYPAAEVIFLNEQKERYDNGVLKTKLMEYEIASLPEYPAGLAYFSEYLDKKNMKRAFQMICARSAGLFGCFSGNDTDGYTFFLGDRSGDARVPGKKFLEQFGGRGGGSAEMFQGSVKVSQAEIHEFFIKYTNN